MSRQQQTLFERPTFDTTTEGVKYAGSKRTILPRLLELIAPLEVESVFDGFAGTTRVSQALHKNGYVVHCNDRAVWSTVFGRCYLLNTKPRTHYQPIMDHLNGLAGFDGWFTEHYGGEANGGESVQADGKKKIWQKHNTRKLDAIREEIDKISNDEVEQATLLTSLILAMDKVDSTVGHQVSYLRQWANRAYDTMKMEVPAYYVSNTQHRISQGDAIDVAAGVNVDLAYFDPPYGSSNEKMPPSRVRYASYYHLWTTICLNDRPEVTGAANRRKDASDTTAGSAFEEFRRGLSGRYVVIEALERLLRSTNAKHIVLSYSNQGRMTFDEIVNLFQSLSLAYEMIEVDYRANVMEGMRWTNEWIDESRGPTREYLFLVSR